MKTIGLIGGITWHSTLEYYRAINTETARRLGATHSAPLLLASLDFHEVSTLGRAGREDEVFALFLQAARALEQGGAQLLALCANTAHRRADRIAAACGVPLVHIGDAIAAAAAAAGMCTLGVLGTERTMAEPFLLDRLMSRGFEVLVPPVAQRTELDRLIVQEMAAGEFTDAARTFVTGACRELAGRGAAGVALACTELPLLMRGVDAGIPLLDTTWLHATAIVDAALA
jgi:aspartate racemase